MQNPPPVPTYPGASQPQISTPMYPYAAPQPGPVQPVSRTNAVANVALTLGILTALGTPVFLFQIVTILNDFHRGASYNYENNITSFLVLFLFGSLFALSSIACGRAGQIKSKLMESRGAACASFGLVFGYFYFFGTFIMILFCIWVAPYYH